MPVMRPWPHASTARIAPVHGQEATLGGIVGRRATDRVDRPDQGRSRVRVIEPDMVMAPPGIRPVHVSWRAGS
jgi:hypothetical protein